MTSVADDPTILPPRHRHLVVSPSPVDDARLETAALAEAMAKMADVGARRLAPFDPVLATDRRRFVALGRRLRRTAEQLRGGALEVPRV